MTSPSTSRPPLFIRLSLPGGLEEALESLAREVLRQQPKDIHQFAAQHFEQQLRKRNKGAVFCCYNTTTIATTTEYASSTTASIAFVGF